VKNIRLTFAYDGTDFQGYQRQPVGRTVQGALESVISRVTNGPITLYGAGRTDSGVHAAGQVANFRTGTRLTTAEMHSAFNALLPVDIAVHRVEEVPETFHARFSARARRYEYRIRNTLCRDVFSQRFELHHPKPLDRDAMIRGCHCLMGERDFASFRASGDSSAHSVRRMIDAGGRNEGEVLILFFEANAFLQHMIRIIVGTLLIVGRGNMTVRDFEKIIDARDRAAAGPTAPPHGLCLTNVRYSD